MYSSWLVLSAILCAVSLDVSNSFSPVLPPTSSVGTMDLKCRYCHQSYGQSSLAMSAEDEQSSSLSETASAEQSVDQSKAPVKCPNCDLCDGSGRIEGGIGVVLKWWPIKAYRPCPNFIERGGFYRRSGQGLDEIAFGRDSKFKVDK